MKTLIIETATEKACLALLSEDRLDRSLFLGGGPDLSKTLALRLSSFLGDLRPDQVAVGRGPGSYTGIRVGAALGQALAFGWQVPLLSFCSLEGFAPYDSPLDTNTAVVLDAKMGGVYVLKGGNQPLRLSIENARKALRKMTLLASPHPQQLVDKLALPIPWVETTPDPHLLFHAMTPGPLILDYCELP